MLRLILPLILFSLTSAFPRKLVPRKASSLNEGNSYIRQEAVALIGSSLPKLPQPITLRTVGKLPVLPTDGEYAEAHDMFKKVMEGKEKNLGKDNLDTLEAVNNLANVSMHQGNYTEAFYLFERVARGKLGKYGVCKLDAFNNLAVVWSVLRKLGLRSDDSSIYTAFGQYIEYTVSGNLKTRPKYIDLRDLYSYLYSTRKDRLGVHHPDTLKTTVGYADLLHDMGSLGTKDMYETVLKAWEATYGTSSPEALSIVDKLANLSYDLKKYVEAKEMYTRALDGREQVLGKTHIDTLSTTNNFANMLLHQGNFSLAKPMYESALKGYENQYGKDHPETLKVVNNLALFHSRYAEERDCKNKHHSIQEAKQGYLRAVVGFEKALGPEHKYYLTALNNQAIMMFQEVKLMDDAMNDGRTASGSMTAVNRTEEDGNTTCNDFFEIAAYP